MIGFLLSQDEDYKFWLDSEVSGWGTTIQGLPAFPTTLQKATVLPVSLAACKLIMGQDRIKPGMICAAGDGTDTCQVRRYLYNLYIQTDLIDTPSSERYAKNCLI